MESIINYLGTGKIYTYPNKKAVSIYIVKYMDITKIIIPFFNKYPIDGVKLYDFQD
jgi:hypothetical protein